MTREEFYAMGFEAAVVLAGELSHIEMQDRSTPEQYDLHVWSGDEHVTLLVRYDVGGVARSVQLCGTDAVMWVDPWGDEYYA